MADYPGTIKSFTDIVDGETDVEATVVNQAYDEIEALEAFIGSFGGGGSYNESLKNLLKQYRFGCEVEFKTTADLYVRSGEMAISDATGNVRIRRNTTDTTVNWVNIDTGAEEASNTYYVYATADDAETTFDVKITKSASLPAGATYYRKIGEFYNNASSNIDKINSYDSRPDSRAVIKGWIKLDGTDTIAIYDSYNVTSITDEGTGDYTITWDSDFSSANYVVVGSNGGGASEWYLEIYGTQTAGACRVYSKIPTSAANGDNDPIHVIAIGDR